ncbi:MAG: hypothetical protein LN575_01595 [Rickettsia endosymbiont of Gnoriste bilineata]|nr:hypothetical protein [Rickettsia endosymbiont of Gnoriste bilineata]
MPLNAALEGSTGVIVSSVIVVEFSSIKETEEDGSILVTTGYSIVFSSSNSSMAGAKFGCASRDLVHSTRFC